MNVLAFMNQKGGVGKTSSACSIAGILVEQGFRVLCVDMDAQASLSVWLGVRDTGTKLLEALLESIGFPDLVTSTASGIDLVPSGTALQNFGRLAQQEPGGDRLLKTCLESIPHRWDFVLVDCGPSLNLASVNALVASRYVVVPVLAEAMSVEPLARILETIRKVQQRLNPDLELLGIVPCRADFRTNHAQQVRAALVSKFGRRMLPSVRDTVRMREAAGFQKTITSFDPGGAGDVDYRSVTEELLRRMSDVETTSVSR